LEIEFHIFKMADARLDMGNAAWPGEPPVVSHTHPGYRLLSEEWADMAHEPLAIVQHTAQGLGLPLSSLEIEFGPSQFEAVFDATDALTAADHFLRFRSGVRQALRRAGYLATFMCKPPFENMIASGWHVHQSVVDLASGANAFTRPAPAAGAHRTDINHLMSNVGEHWLTGLLEHAGALCALSVPTVNGYSRFQKSTMAPQGASWGRDNRGTSFRVLGEAGSAATRIENRLGEPMANPYLVLAAQIHAGLDGVQRQLRAPQANASPYTNSTPSLPATLGQALDALQADSAFVQACGPQFIAAFTQIKRAELARFDAAPDKLDWQRREYFSRY
jgi:glutamine synthetase